MLDHYTLTTKIINQSMIIKQSDQHVDNYRFGLCKRKHKSKINTLKRHDIKIKTLTQLYEVGLIDFNYYDYGIKDVKIRSINLNQARLCYSGDGKGTRKKKTNPRRG